MAGTLLYQSRRVQTLRRKLLMENYMILSALKAIDVSTLSRADWISVGMALKEEGFPCSVWDDWSRNDKRYHPGECTQMGEFPGVRHSRQGRYYRPDGEGPGLGSPCR